jgi:YidC/Oxa1 family membrane protein insertase
VARNESQIDPKRFLLAMVISAILLFVWQSYFMPTPPPQPAETANQTAAQVADTTQSQTKPMEVVPVPAKEVAKRVDTIRTKHFELQFSNQGARLVSTKVLEPAQYIAAGDLLGDVPRDGRFPFAVGFLKDAQVVPSTAMFELDEAKSVKAGDVYTTLAYRYVDPAGQFVLHQTYVVEPSKPYELKLDVRVQNVSGQSITNALTFDVAGYKNPEETSSFLDPRPDAVESICKLTDDLERKPYGSVESPMKFGTAEELVTWAGVDKRYFLFAAVPEKPFASCEFETLDENYLRTRLVSSEMTIAAGQAASHHFRLFVGPKDQDVLDAAGADLAEAIDYGMLAFLSRPMRWLLVMLYGFVNNWGFAIILLTIIVRLLMWPMNHKVYANSERMKDIQPIINSIKEKYKDDQQRQAEETMKAFKENNVSALGCAPMLLQFPIFLALYFMILNSVELYQANFAFWYVDLSAPDPYFVLPVAMGVVMLIQQSMMTVEAPNPQMQTIMKIMPITFTAFMLFLPSGVVLYYFASMLIGIIQQYMIKKQFEKKRAKASA